MAFLYNMHPMSTDVIPWDDTPEWTTICEETCDQYLHSSKSSNQALGTFCQRPMNDTYNPKQHDTYWSDTVEALKQRTTQTAYTPSSAPATESHPDFLSLGGNPSPPASSSMSFAPFNHGDKTNASYLTAAQSCPASPAQVTGTKQCAVETSTFPHNFAWTITSSMSSTKSSDSDLEDSWQDIFGPDAQQSDHSSSSSQTCRTISPAPAWLSQDICGLPSLGLPNCEFVATEPGSSCTSKQATAAEYDSSLWPLAQSLQQTHILSPSHHSWSRADVESKDAYYATSCSINLQHSALPSVGDIASLDVSAGTLSQLPRPYRLSGHSVTGTYHNQSHSAFGPTTQMCSASAFDSPDMSPLNDLLGMNNAVSETTEEHDPLYSMFPGDDLDVKAEHSSQWPITTSSLSSSQTARSCQLVTPRNTSTSFPVSSYPNAMPLHRRYHFDLECGYSELARGHSASPGSPSITVAARRPHSSRRSTSSRCRLRPACREKVSARGGFVNYTPQDHNKILSGVAPSGSFKTKARRDKETERRRKQISQAAVRAVVEAGGNLERLRDEGLLV